MRILLIEDDAQTAAFIAKLEGLSVLLCEKAPFM